MGQNLLFLSCNILFVSHTSCVRFGGKVLAFIFGEGVRFGEGIYLLFFEEKSVLEEGICLFKFDCFLFFVVDTFFSLENFTTCEQCLVTKQFIILPKGLKKMKHQNVT